MKLLDQFKRNPVEIFVICAIVVGATSSLFVTLYEMRLSYIAAKHDADLAGMKNNFEDKLKKASDCSSKTDKMKSECQDKLAALQKEWSEKKSAPPDCSFETAELRRYYEFQTELLQSELSVMRKYLGRKKDETYVVRPGDTLSVIAVKIYGDSAKWTELYRANKHLIRDADAIKTDWKLYVPDAQTLLAVADAHAPAMTIVTGNNYAPYTGQDLPNRGMITEIVARVFEEMGHHPKIEFWSWKYGYDAALECGFSATFPYLKNEEREKKFHFSEPLYDVLISCFVRDDFSGDFEKPEDLKGLTLCEAEGYFTPGLQDLVMNKVVKLKQTKELGTCFKMLKNGRVDAVPVDQLVGRSQIKTLYGSTKGFRELAKAIAIKPLFLIIPKCYPNANVLTYKFNETLAELKKNGMLREIVKTHLDNYY